MRAVSAAPYCVTGRLVVVHLCIAWPNSVNMCRRDEPLNENIDTTRTRGRATFLPGATDLAKTTTLQQPHSSANLLSII